MAEQVEEQVAETEELEQQETPEPTEPTEPAAEPTEPTEPATRWWTAPSTPVLAGVAAALVLLLAAAVVFGWLYLDERAEQADRDAALDTAMSYAVTVTSYDYQDPDKDLADAMDGATGAFKNDFAAARDALRKLIMKAEATATAEVLHAGIKSFGDDRAQVVLFLDQQVTNAATKKPRVDRSRALMSLEKHDGRWLCAGLKLL